jgi:hypothetical protein
MNYEKVAELSMQASPLVGGRSLFFLKFMPYPLWSEYFSLQPSAFNLPINFRNFVLPLPPISHHH